MSEKHFQALRIAAIIALVLVLGIAWQFATGISSSRATVSSTVTLSGERIAQSSAAAADFDGDGDKEIVIGGQDGILYVLAYDGSFWSVVWSRQTATDLNAAGAPSGSPCVTSKSDIRSAPAIADLDNDGHLEIVVTTGGDTGHHRNGGVLVYRYNSAWSFSLVPGWPQPRLDIVGAGAGASYPDGCWDGIWGSPALGDLDGDGDLEVVVEGFDRRLHAWHHNGAAMSGWPISRDNGDALLRGGWASPALGDIDGDGLPEAVFGTDSPPWGGDDSPVPDYSKATVWAVNGDGSSVPGWPVTTDNNIQSSPALGDIDGDEQLEIVVGSGDSDEGGNGKKVYAWNGDGSVVGGWPKSTGGDMQASPALGDLDGDGDLEVVIGCGTDSDPSCNWLYAWNGNGDFVSGFPVSPPNNSWMGDTAQGLPYPPVLADYDGDGLVEILLVHRGSFGVATVSSSGQSENDPDLKTVFTLSSSPLVDDVDGDNYLEVVIGGSYQEILNSNGAVYIWDVNGNAYDAQPWPMFHQNIKRTGTQEQYTISGRAVHANGQPFFGVTVSTGSGPSDVTDASGDYEFTGLDEGTYTLTPSLGSYVFFPANRTVTLPPNASGQSFFVLPSPVSTNLVSGTATSLIYTDTQILPTQLDFAADAVTQTTNLVLTPTMASGGAGFAFTGHAFELAAYQGGVLQPGFTFSTPVTITIHYSEQDAAETCDPVSPYIHDLSGKTVTVAVCHLSCFALLGPTNKVYLPIVFRGY